jgi:putative PIN family toxin of toxin-antitoxin system
LPVPRAVADTNVWVAAAITPRGVCGRLLQAFLDGRWQPVLSPALIDELRDVLERPKFRRWISDEEAHRFVSDLQVLAEEVADPPARGPRRTIDPDDEFLVALVGAARVDALISGDPHLLEIQGADMPVVTPAAFLDRLSVEP